MMMMVGDHADDVNDDDDADEDEDEDGDDVIEHNATR